MQSKFLLIYKILKNIKRMTNNMLVEFFVKNQLFALLNLLFFFNLKKIKGVGAKDKINYRVIVLAKSGGLEDLVCSQKKYNKNIQYYKLPREFIYKIYSTIFSIKHPIDIKNLSTKEIKTLKIKYKNFLIKFVKIIKTNYRIDAWLGFNYEYAAEEDLHTVCSELNIPFLVLYKESVATELENLYRKYLIKKKKKKFNGYKISTYSEYGKKLLVDAKLVNKNKIEVVGCSRLSKSFLYKKIKPKNQIVYYVIENYRGLQNFYVEREEKKFFNNLKIHRKYNSNYNWKKLHTGTVKMLKKFALKYPNVSIIFKVKTGQPLNSGEYINLPKNIKVSYYGVGHELLKESKIVIGWNTTALLEGIAANRFILLPYFLKYYSLKTSEKRLNLNLKKENYGYSENDFFKKLIYFINKEYKINKINNNQYSLKHHLGNADNKADFRLDKFLRENIPIKN